MSEAPYYVTWSSQKNFELINIKATKEHSFITDQGQEVHDLSSLSLQASFGLNPVFAVEAVQKQLSVLPITPIKSQYSLKQEATLKLLRQIEQVNNPKGKIFYTVSGAESIENALKISRQITGRKIVLARTRSYHGATMGALSITGDWRNAGHLLPREWTQRLPEPEDDLDGKKTISLIETIGASNICALCIETVSGANGVEHYTQAWWQTVPKFLKSKGIKLILDEVVCGFGRTGKYFGFHHFNVDPDIITLAKSISAGLIPFGAVWTNAEVSDFYNNQVLSCGLTQYANPSGLAAMNAVLEKIEHPQFKENCEQLLIVHHHFIEKLKNFANIKVTRQFGHLMAIEFRQPMDWLKFHKAGFYFIAKENMCILAPALTYNPHTLSEIYEKFIIKAKELS